MKRWSWAAVAAVPVVTGAIWWAVPDTADVAVITAITPDGTVTWVDGEIRPAEENNSEVHELPGEKHVSRLADDVVIRTPFGCGQAEALTLTVFGLGDAPCARADFLADKEPIYAPRLTFNGDGEITEIQGRYHP
ncbi:hypothetical protein [Lentzea sp. NBRC 102530]|uniref:hypothetical protein n=1 Tax=Lentzea sp. NBRC 102530 TaxID=3032201 RepID=UPI0025550F79|nr:hypothetical protein [Lentzea sp. NBRC 102530]